MRKILVPLFFVLATSAHAQSIKDSVFAAWLEEIEFLDTVCGTVSLSTEQRERLLSQASIEASSFERGGELFKPYISARTFASDKFADMNISGHCYHLKNALGENGFIEVDVLD